MILFVYDHMMCSEFIGVCRYMYQLPVVSDTIVLVPIFPVSYLSCQISVVRLSVSIDISNCWRYQLLHIHIDCLFIKDTITRGTGVIA